MDLGYNNLIAIQSSAFLMTLVRKGLVRWYTHAFWYSVALILSWMYMYQCFPLIYWAKFVFCYQLRCTFRMNKYLMWAIHAFLALPLVENAILSEIETYRSTMQTPEFSFFTNPVSI